MSASSIRAPVASTKPTNRRRGRRPLVRDLACACLRAILRVLVIRLRSAPAQERRPDDVDPADEEIGAAPTFAFTLCSTTSSATPSTTTSADRRRLSP